MARRLHAGTLAAVALVSGAAAVCALELHDLERWAGTGTNLAALALCWDDGASPSCLAWGYRWNGAATMSDLWTAVAAGDPGLSLALTGGLVTAAAYRRPGLPEDERPRVTGPDAIRTSYAVDHLTVTGGTWQAWAAAGPVYHPMLAQAVTAPPATLALPPESWVVLVQSTGAMARTPGYPLPAVHDPFATGVIAYDFGSGIPPFDYLNGNDFTQAVTALGRPAIDTTGDHTHIEEPEIVPVHPGYPAFRANELVTVGSGGILILAFDHPVLDHPLNPYGVDLLGFGNAFSALATPWTNGSPETAILAGSSTAESGDLSVSQDGTTWHSLGEHPLDGFAPTAGRCIDPAHPDPALGTNNLWWGGPSDPTLPVDPSVDPETWTGRTLGDIVRRYRGGAGGCGIDISGLPLPSDPTTGHKWFRYLRIEGGEAQPEVDAVADVSPVFPWHRWQMSRFAWMDPPEWTRPGANPDGDAADNLFEYLGGRDPITPEPTPWPEPMPSDTAPGEVEIPTAPGVPDAALGLLQASALSPAAAWHPTPCRYQVGPDGRGMYHAERGAGVAFWRWKAVRHD